MLILRRKSGESIVIGEDIHVTVLDINEGSVRLAIDAPKSIPILRSELLQAADANRDSAVTEQTQSRSLLRFLGGKSGPEQASMPTKNRPRAVRPGFGGRPKSAEAAQTPDAQSMDVPQQAEAAPVSIPEESSPAT